jgi:hypothetical protein
MTSSPVKRARVDESSIDEEPRHFLFFLGTGKHGDSVLVRFSGTKATCDKVIGLVLDLEKKLDADEIPSSCLVDLFEAVEHSETRDAKGKRFEFNPHTAKCYLALSAFTTSYMWNIERNEDIPDSRYQNVYELHTFSTD